MEKRGCSHVGNLLLTRKLVASAQISCLRLWPYVCLMVAFSPTRPRVHPNKDQQDEDPVVLLGMIGTTTQYGLV